MDKGYTSNRDHLLTELRRIEVRLMLQLERFRQQNKDLVNDKFRGLYISEQDIDNLASAASTLINENITKAEEPQPSNLIQSLTQLEEEISTKREKSLSCGIPLRLEELRRIFNLSQLEIDILLICLLPEINLKYQKLYAYLQDDATKKSPSVDLVLQLLCTSLDDRLNKTDAFLAESPLIQNNLIYLKDEHPLRVTPLLAKLVQIDGRIASYLLDQDQVDNRLLSYAYLVKPRFTLDDMVIDVDTKQCFSKLAVRFKNESIVCYLEGPYGIGKKTTAEAVCYDLVIPILFVDIGLLLSQDMSATELIALIFREGKLQNAALFLDNFGELLADTNEKKQLNRIFLTQIENFPSWVFLSGSIAWEPKGYFGDKQFINIDLPFPSYSERLKMWQKFSSKRLELPEDINLEDISNKFRFTGGQIQDAITTIRNSTLWQDHGDGALAPEAFYSSCRKQSRKSLTALARKINPGYVWHDIILPTDHMAQLNEICSYIKHYQTVYETWGFSRKLSLGKGLNVLFAGPSGTGKTMAAEIVANELGLDLYKIDLSTIVSKYIGETEKNLDRIFREGQSLNAILFFDEADALFGKRSEVRDSHDRYANIEIAYLLQKMEEYQGIVILATNLKKNMDEAFARRMHFTVEFPVPDAPDRHRIWQIIFPNDAPLSEDIDLDFLAKQFKITGGNIRNIALGAAFLAAADGCLITMENLIKATKREYQKMGKLCTEGDFVHYFKMVKG